MRTTRKSNTSRKTSRKTSSRKTIRKTSRKTSRKTKKGSQKRGGGGGNEIVAIQDPNQTTYAKYKEAVKRAAQKPNAVQFNRNEILKQVNKQEVYNNAMENVRSGKGRMKSSVKQMQNREYLLKKDAFYKAQEQAKAEKEAAAAAEKEEKGDCPSKNITDDQIKAACNPKAPVNAFKKMLFKLHPDKNLGCKDDATIKTKACGQYNNPPDTLEMNHNETWRK